MKTRKLIMLGMLVACMAGTSCTSTKQVAYFQDLNPGEQNAIIAATPIRFEPNDKVTIVVSTGDGRLNSLFSLAVSRNTIGVGGTSSSLDGGSSDSGTAAYTIDSHGDISFPVLGKLHVAGMTREELAEYVRRELVSRDLAKNPIVTVEYLNLTVTVLGEVGSPGRQAINREGYSILDAIGEAGDLTIFGQRDNIKVLREENGMQRVYEVNLNDGKQLIQSPVYFLRQNDVIYVEPNNTKKRNSTPNGNTALTPAFWISMASFITSMAILIVNQTK